MNPARRLLEFVTGRTGWKGLPESPTLRNVLPASEFDRLFQRERALSDRVGHSFALVTFTSRGEVRDGDLQQLGQVLSDRMRATDIAGRLDSERVAILLAHTDGPGGWVFADHILEQLGATTSRFNCEVYCYPSAEEGQAIHRPRLLEPDQEDVGQDADQAQGEDREDIGEASAVANGFDRLSTTRESQQRPVHDLAPYFMRQPSPMRRLVDILVSGTLLLLLAPLLILVAIAVAVSTPGPIIFHQLRAGRGGEPFRFYKFRSMYLDAEARKAALQAKNEAGGTIFKIKNDPRLTPLGRILRRWSIDELPQLFNVLRGDMTLIGPRPPTLDEVPRYKRWQLKRLQTTGGLTCIWQVSGRSEIPFEEWVRMDLRYLERQSLWLDLQLLFRTFFAVLSGRGAY